MLNPKKSVQNMSGYFVPMYEKDWDIKIDSNENNYGPSPLVIKALKEFNYKNISFYPFYGELTQKIADFINFQPENIKVTNGADEAIQSIIQTYLERDEALLTPDISFDMPIIYTKIQGGDIIKVPFKEKWIFPTNDFIEQAKNPKVKLIYLATPNNPTGNIIQKRDIINIIENARDKAIIIDETYANYSDYTNNELAKQYDNVFIVHSFSKDFALAGMRLGYIISNEENINNLKKVVSPFSVNTFAMKAGIVALNDISYFNNIKKEVTISKEELTEFFSELGGNVYPSHANFLLVDFKEKAEFVYNKLKNNNIAVKLYKKGHILENHLRITIPTKQGVKKIKDILKNKPFLVFDMDGVLVDARKSYRIAIEKTFEKFSGKQISQKEIQVAKNLGGLNNDWDLTEYLLKQAGFNIKYDDIVDCFQKIYWNNGTGLINEEEALFDLSLFKDLSEKYNLSIFTGRLKQEAMYALDKFNATDLFYPIITMDDIPKDKGKPDSYGLNLIKALSIGKEYYYFGDTTDDIKSATGANYIAVGVLPPQDKSDELQKSYIQYGANYTIKTINDIEQILEKNNERVC